MSQEIPQEKGFQNNFEMIAVGVNHASFFLNTLSEPLKIFGELTDVLTFPVESTVLSLTSPHSKIQRSTEHWAGPE